MKKRNRASYIIAFCTTLIRYYDYALFGLSASVISKSFMPSADETEQLFYFFAIFSIAVLARPFGSLIFGKIGDLIGRVAAVKIAAIIAAISTSFIGFIPKYQDVGSISVLLLLLCRMMFLISLAGDTDAIKIYIAEKISKRNRHFANGLVSFSSQIGVLIAATLYYFAMNFEEVTWLWRVNFLIGGIGGITILLLRKYFEESEVYLKNKRKQQCQLVNLGIMAIIKNYKIEFLLAIFVIGALGGVYHFLIIFLNTFAASIDIISTDLAKLYNMKLVIIYSIASLISGIVADRVNIQKQITLSLTASLILILIVQLMMNINVFLVSVHMLLVFLAPFYVIPSQIAIQSLFPSRLRMRMFSLSHSIGSVCFSSSMPFLGMVLWKYTEMFSVVISLFIMLLGVLFFAFAYINRMNYENFFEKENIEQEA
ncbi:MAG: MFS transporter [Rickettsiaceae bacterium]|nr:MFS transporter [Rickettsiaceae bacterium]